jgi:oxazoline/thiazoline dehydrogenase
MEPSPVDRECGRARLPAPTPTPAHASTASTTDRVLRDPPHPFGELLYHASRVIDVVPGPLGPFAPRPYPCGGASYELEVYLVVDRCLGLAPGFYRYDAEAHHLAALRAPDVDTDALLDGACAASGASSRPQVLLTIAARFQRQSWKYAGIAYATTLKDLGALYATLYLVATAMGLAPCALGVGDSERFCRLAGTDRYTEATVGEFMIGSRL